jgi:hypothetical protein
MRAPTLSSTVKQSISIDSKGSSFIILYKISKFSPFNIERTAYNASNLISKMEVF